MLAYAMLAMVATNSISEAQPCCGRQENENSSFAATCFPESEEHSSIRGRDLWDVGFFQRLFKIALKILYAANDEGVIGTAC